MIKREKLMIQDVIKKNGGKNTLEWLRRSGARCTVEDLTLGVNLDSPSTVTKDKAVYNDPGRAVNVRLGTYAAVFSNVSASFSETESKVLREK